VLKVVESGFVFKVGRWPWPVGCRFSVAVMRWSRSMHLLYIHGDWENLRFSTEMTLVDPWPVFHGRDIFRPWMSQKRHQMGP